MIFLFFVDSSRSGDIGIEVFLVFCSCCLLILCFFSLLCLLFYFSPLYFSLCFSTSMLLVASQCYG
jgi:hypothetical protein